MELEIAPFLLLPFHGKIVYELVLHKSSAQIGDTEISWSKFFMEASTD